MKASSPPSRQTAVELYSIPRPRTSSDRRGHPKDQMVKGRQRSMFASWLCATKNPP